MTFDDATKEVERINSTDPDWFCPVINGDCNCRCYSLQKAEVNRIYQHVETGWVCGIIERRCTHPSLRG